MPITNSPIPISPTAPPHPYFVQFLAISQISEKLCAIMTQKIEIPNRYHRLYKGQLRNFWVNNDVRCARAIQLPLLLFSIDRSDHDDD